MEDLFANELSASELKAIQEHKYYMSIEKGVEVSIEDAIKDFREKYLDDLDSEDQWKNEDMFIKLDFKNYNNKQYN